MYWKLSVLPPLADEAAMEAEAAGRRFVLQRHRDADGPHLDLRLEQAGYCCGWRIEDTALHEVALATEKGPHPTRWLEQDGSAERVDEGTYCWERRENGEGVVVLRGRDGVRRIAVSRAALLPVSSVRAIRDTVKELGVEPSTAAGLVRDGHVARERAIARFCGLGRELDGQAFDETLWRRTLRGCSLDELQSHLRGYEIRFDAKYPPTPVSKPEPLADEGEPGDAARAVAILTEG